MMTCIEAEESLESRAAGLLEEERLREIDLHLEGCTGCSSAALQLDRLEERLSQGDDLERQAAARVAPLRSRLQSALLAPAPREPRWKMLFAAAAVALCLFVIKGILWPPGESASPAQAPQEPTIEDLAARLGDDRIEVRTDAMRRLIDLGPAILPRLRKLPAPQDPEARALLADTIRRLEELEAIVPFKPVTLNAHERPAKEVLLEVARQAGIAPTLFVFRPDAGEDIVSISLKDATPLQAVDEICRKAFALVPRRNLRPADQSFEFWRVPPEAAPAAYVRHYRMAFSALKVRNVGGNSSGPLIQLEFSWSPHVRPYAFSGVQDLEILDDQDRSLLARIPTARPAHFHPVEFMKDHRELIPLKVLPAGTKSLSVRGRMEFRFALKRETLVFDAPRTQKGKTFEVDGMTVSLQEFKEQGPETLIELETEEKPGMMRPFSRAEVEAVTESGARLSAGYQSGMSSRNNKATWHFIMKSPTPDPVREVRIPVVRTFATDRVEFELKGVPVPP